MKGMNKSLFPFYFSVRVFYDYRIIPKNIQKSINSTGKFSRFFKHDEYNQKFFINKNNNFFIFLIKPLTDNNLTVYRKNK